MCVRTDKLIDSFHTKNRYAIWIAPPPPPSPVIMCTTADGLCCNHGVGYFEIYLDDILVRTGSRFSSILSTIVHVPTDDSLTNCGLSWTSWSECDAECPEPIVAPLFSFLRDSSPSRKAATLRERAIAHRAHGGGEVYSDVVKDLGNELLSVLERQGAAAGLSYCDLVDVASAAGAAGSSVAAVANLATASTACEIEARSTSGTTTTRMSARTRAARSDLVDRVGSFRGRFARTKAPIAAVSATSRTRTSTSSRILFDSFDADADGILDAGELRIAIRETTTTTTSAGTAAALPPSSPPPATRTASPTLAQQRYGTQSRPTLFPPSSASIPVAVKGGTSTSSTSNEAESTSSDEATGTKTRRALNPPTRGCSSVLDRIFPYSYPNNGLSSPIVSVMPCVISCNDEDDDDDIVVSPPATIFS